MTDKIESRLNLKYLIANGYLTYYMCCMCVIVTALYVNYLPPFMILWGIFWLLENRKEISSKFAISSPARTLLFAFLILYAWQICGLFFAYHLNIGVDRILKRLSFLLFPLVLFYPGKMILSNLNKVLKLFVYSSLIFVLFCFFLAFYRSISFQTGHFIFNPHPIPYGWENYFYGHFLSNYIHPSYLSMYIVVAIIISIKCLFTERLRLFKMLSWILIILIFLVSLFFLSSRSGVLVGIIIVPLSVFLYARKYGAKWLVLLILPIILFSAIVALHKNGRFNYSYHKMVTHTPGKVVIDENRISIWKSAIGVIKKHVILGVGTGDATEELKSEFKSRGYVEGYYDNLNAHNQYLEILLENGLIGFLIFMWLVGLMVYHAFIDHNIQFGLFILTIMIFFFFETMLNRLAGVTFFPFFSFLFFHLNNKNSESELIT